MKLHKFISTVTVSWLVSTTTTSAESTLQKAPPVIRKTIHPSQNLINGSHQPIDKIVTDPVFRKILLGAWRNGRYRIQPLNLAVMKEVEYLNVVKNFSTETGYENSPNKHSRGYVGITYLDKTGSKITSK